jgi:uncharacterized protein (TIGR03086 family)
VDQLATHQRAQDVFAGVLANVTPDQLDGPSPCAEWNVKAVIEHVLAGNQLVARRATGEEPSALPADLVAAHAQSAATAQAIFAGPEGLTRVYRLPIGEVPGTVFISLRTIDLFTHAWDVAKATGQARDLDPEMADELLAASQAIMSPDLRGPAKPFAAEQAAGPGSSRADVLAAYLGRSTA